MVIVYEKSDTKTPQDSITYTALANYYKECRNEVALGGHLLHPLGFCLGRLHVAPSWLSLSVSLTFLEESFGANFKPTFFCEFCVKLQCVSEAI